MPGALTDDIPIFSEQGLGYDGDKVGMLRRRADIKRVQGDKHNLGAAIGQQGVHPQPDGRHYPNPPKLMEVHHPVPEAQEDQGEARSVNHVRTGPEELVEGKDQSPYPGNGYIFQK